ncbi:hypothetical protein QZK27_17650 [Acinetobacter baumannii]|nr:hypothetical protein [Acinetobacter baumannii]
MKKLIYILLILFSFLGINSAYAADNYTPGQDLGNPDGSITIPNAPSPDKGNAIYQEMSKVTEQGMGLLENLLMKFKVMSIRISNLAYKLIIKKLQRQFCPFLLDLL